MTQKTRIAAVGAIGLSVAGIIGLLFFLIFEKSTETVHRGGKPEVIRDDWAALSRAVDARGYYSERIPAGTDFWNGDSTLIFCGPGFMETLKQDDMDALDQFIGEYGARLVVSGLPVNLESYAGQPAAALLDFCGISTEPMEEKPESRKSSGDGLSLGSIVIEGRDEGLPVQWGDGQAIPLAGDLALLSKGTLTGETRWIQAAYGKGSITFCSDSDFFHNAGLGNEGHAAMLAWLISDDTEYELIGIEDGTVTVAEKKFPWSKITVPLGVFCAMLVWSRGPRFGPVLEAANRDRRSIAERFMAEGGFLWTRTAPGTLEALVTHTEFRKKAKKQNAGEFLDLMNKLEAGKLDGRKDRRKI